MAEKEITGYSFTTLMEYGKICDSEGKLAEMEEAAANSWILGSKEGEPINESLDQIHTGDADIDFVIRLMKYPRAKKMIITFALVEIYEGVLKEKFLKKWQEKNETLKLELKKTEVQLKNAKWTDKFKIRKRIKEIKEDLDNIKIQNY